MSESAVVVNIPTKTRSLIKKVLIGVGVTAIAVVTLAKARSIGSDLGEMNTNEN